MKNKLISTLMIVALACAALVGGTVNSSEVFAAGNAATLVDTKVSFDGKEPVIIQSYRIDGFNYVRVAEIAQHIGMGVMPAYHEVGVLIQPTEPYTGGDIEKITEQSINTELTTGTVFYDGMRYENAGCFKHNNRYYYKLADLIAASQYALEQNIEFTKSKANSSYYKEARIKSYPSFEISWDSMTGLVKVSRQETDLQEIFEAARDGKGIMHGKEVSETPVIAAQSNLTEPPEVGSFPANVLVDKSKSAYNVDGTINRDNLTECYKNTSGSLGQCTWYAVSRFREVTGVNPCESYAFFGNSDWVGAAKSGKFPQLIGISDVTDIRDRCIAEWETHVVFVEYVERDSNGEPINVYYTEANQNHNGNPYKEGVYYPDFDGKVKVKTFSDFINHKSSGNPLRGYIVAK